MTEAQDAWTGLLDTPCQFCNADAGEPCRDDCEALEANWPGIAVDDGKGGDSWLSGETDETKASLQSAVYRLPFVGSFMQPPNYRGRDNDEWISELGIWLDQYNKYAKSRIEKLESDSRRAIGLQLEKDIVRKFFMGTAQAQQEESK